MISLHNTLGLVVDELVQKALARWPNVPAIAGWLKLNMQGEWLLTGHAQENLTIGHSGILNFIARNYSCEADGRFYFQNGPQKAYVHLAYTPWVYRIYQLANGDLMLGTHTGLIGWPLAFYQDEQGRVLINGEHGAGLLHSNDVNVLAVGLQEHSKVVSHTATWAVPDAPSSLVSARIGLRRNERTLVGRRDCVFMVQPIESARVAELFKFEPNPFVKPPLVNQPESNQ